MTTNYDFSLSPHRPFDESMWDQFILYDNMPYTWSPDNEMHLTLESGNVIKGYRCRIQEPYEIKH